MNKNISFILNYIEKEKKYSNLGRNNFKAESEGFESSHDWQANHLYNNLAPSSEFVYNQFLPTLLLRIHKLGFLKGLPFTQIRDGANSLATFFSKVPKPIPQMPLLIIHERHRHLVPSLWSKKIVLYRDCYQSHKTTFKNQEKIKKLIIFGHIAPYSYSFDLLKNFVSKTHLRNKYDEIKFYIKYNTELYINNDQNIALQETNLFNKLIYDKIEKPQILHINKIKETANLKEYDFLDIDQAKNFISQSFVTQTILANGARPYLRKKNNQLKSHFLVQTSPYSGIELIPFYQTAEDIRKREELNTYIKVMHKDDITSPQDTYSLVTFLDSISSKDPDYFYFV